MSLMEARDWLDLVYENPIAFGHDNGFTDLTDIHNEWLRLFLFSEEDVTLQAHRGSYKTTCISIAIALLMVLEPNSNIIFLRKTDVDVKEVINQVAQLLQSQMFVDFSYALYGKKIEVLTASATEVHTNLKDNVTGSKQLLGLGMSSSITGKHADKIFTDDIINIKDRISKAERTQTDLAYQELQNVKNRGGRIVNTGTPWHVDDTFKLMPNTHRYDCYETGLMSDAEIEKLRKSMSPSLFSANYELKHISDEDLLFANPTIDETGNASLYIQNGIMQIDASYGGSDYTAMTICKEAPDGTVYVYGELHSKHVDELIYRFEMARDKYKASTLYCETNADKGYLLQKFREPTRGYHERMNKHVKISTYLRERWSDIVFLKETDPQYIAQILDYNENADHDDAPDSLASAIRQLTSKPLIYFA